MNKKSKIDGYSLSRAWFNYCFENPEKINPNHTALFFFAIEHCNRLAWKEKFGLPTTMAMEAIGIKSYKTYIKALRELIDMGFIVMIQKSKNQYSSNIIALVENTKAHAKALDKAMAKHGLKQVQSKDSIVKPRTKNQEPRTKFTPPTLEEFKAYCQEDLKEYALDAENIFHSYNDADWHDSRGTAIKNWKQKLRQVWCKPENGKRPTVRTYDPDAEIHEDETL